MDNVVAEPCALPRDFALQYLPQSGLASFLGLLGAYDTRDSLDFPRSGLVGTGQVGLGFGSDYRNPDYKLAAALHVRTARARLQDLPKT